MPLKAIGRALGLGPTKTTTSQTSTPTRPAEVEGAVSDLISRSRAFADQPFEAYDQPRIAGFTPDELAGFEAARGVASASGALAPLTGELVQEGVAASRDLATRLPETDLSGYMSPFTEAVLDPTIRALAERSAQERLRLGQQSARTGSFGGSRQAIAESELERGTQRNISEETARQRAAAYNSALQQFRLDQGIRKCCHIDGDKGLLSTAAIVVDCRSDEFLAGAGFTYDQNGRIGYRYFSDLIKDFSHFRRLPDHSTDSAFIDGVLLLGSSPHGQVAI